MYLFFFIRRRVPIQQTGRDVALKRRYPNTVAAAPEHSIKHTTRLKLSAEPGCGIKPATQPRNVGAGMWRLINDPHYQKTVNGKWPIVYNMNRQTDEADTGTDSISHHQCLANKKDGIHNDTGNLQTL